jgi:hypothetical protein
MTWTDLCQFERETREHPRRAANRMFGQAAIIRKAEVALLNRYARNKLEAMYYRRNGDITRALRYETYCDALYDRLPAYARW